MKFIKSFKKRGDKIITNSKVMSREGSETLFDNIVNNFDISKLSRHDSGPWGYFFKYDGMIINQKSIEIDNIFYTLPIDIQEGIVDFLESKGKGTISEVPYSG